MSTLVTPSAKSHERVTGRWVRDIEAASRMDWGAYYSKIFLGTPVPWLLLFAGVSVFVSGMAAEVALWGTAGLSLLYIAVDRLSRTKEFHFFKIGGDFMLISAFVLGLISISRAASLDEAIETLVALRWIPLCYLIAYAWELFPGLNRAFFLMSIAVTIISALAIWQNFSGVDLLSSAPLIAGPGVAGKYFCAVGFFPSPEILGTALAVFLPFPVMVFALRDRMDKLKIFSIFLCVLISLALFFTYRPGLWMAGLAGLFVAFLMPGRRQWLLSLGLIGLIFISIFVFYPSRSQFTESVMQEQSQRGAEQRAQINNQVHIWSESPWLGVGAASSKAAKADAKVGNVYFQILAQTGALGLSFYLLFSLGFLLGCYRILQEVPRTHFWHRVLICGGVAGLVAFHTAGLFCFTLSESLSAYLFVFILSSLAYLNHHYTRGLVPDDQSL